MEDQEIIGLFQERNECALKECELAYGNQLQRLAARFVSEEDAKECVNDTWLAAWNSIPPVVPRFLFAYLAKLCRNLAYNRIDYDKAAKRNAIVVELTAEMEECLPDKRIGQEAEEYDFGMLLSEFLYGQRKEYRMVFVRRYWYGDSIKEIADIYGYSQTKVKSILFRMRKRLKEYLKKEGVWKEI